MAFLNGATHVNASHSDFSNIGRNQYNNPHNRNHINNSGTFNGSTINQNIREGAINHYNHPVHQGDRFYGAIYGGIVGGRGNTNVINNQAGFDKAWGEQERLDALRTELEAHRKRQRVQNLQAELTEAQAQLDALSGAQDD